MSPLRLRRIADLDTPRILRHRLKAWLHTTTLRATERDDFLLAVDEAVVNVVDHAYTHSDTPGEVSAVIEIAQDLNDQACVVATVTDRGRWRPPPRDPGHRGRGLALMKCCTAWMRIEPSDVGTRVVMGTIPL